MVLFAVAYFGFIASSHISDGYEIKVGTKYGISRVIDYSLIKHKTAIGEAYISPVVDENRMMIMIIMKHQIEFQRRRITIHKKYTTSYKKVTYLNKR